LSTISESTRSSDSTSTDEKTQRDSKITVLDGSQIEVFSETPSTDSKAQQVDVLKDFRSAFERQGDAASEQCQLLLRQYGFDKPLEMQRKVLPLVMSAFRDEQKSFITVQGAPQCGKTSALVLGILGAVGWEMGGIRAVALSTSCTRGFKKYFDICSEVHPLKLECYESINRKVSFEGLPPDPDSAMAGVDPLEDLQRLSSALASGAPAMVYGHPSRVLPLLREAPSWGVDLSHVQVLALDDAEETICMGLMDEVCEVCTILRHFSKYRLRHIILSHFLSHEAKSMIRCLRNSLLQQQNLFGIRAHRTQARAKSVNHYYAVAARPRWPVMLAALHHALSLPSGIIFDDASPEARAQVRLALRAQGVTASVWNALQEQGSGARAAARDGAAAAPRGPAFHLMPSDLVVLKVDLPQVRCVLHFEVPRRELSVYGLRLMCLEQMEQKKVSRKGTPSGRSLSVLFVEDAEVVRELEKTFHIRMEEVPTEMLGA
jgi:superfamily II DNA/RNA helicase